MSFRTYSAPKSGLQQKVEATIIAYLILINRSLKTQLECKSSYTSAKPRLMRPAFQGTGGDYKNNRTGRLGFHVTSGKVHQNPHWHVCLHQHQAESSTVIAGCAHNRHGIPIHCFKRLICRFVQPLVTRHLWRWTDFDACKRECHLNWSPKYVIFSKGKQHDILTENNLMLGCIVVDSSYYNWQVSTTLRTNFWRRRFFARAIEA
jgi:hypothetical protein